MRTPSSHRSGSSFSGTRGEGSRPPASAKAACMPRGAAAAIGGGEGGCCDPARSPRMECPPLAFTPCAQCQPAVAVAACSVSAPRPSLAVRTASPLQQACVPAAGPAAQPTGHGRAPAGNVCPQFFSKCASAVPHTAGRPASSMQNFSGVAREKTNQWMPMTEVGSRAAQPAGEGQGQCSRQGQSAPGSLWRGQP